MKPGCGETTTDQPSCPGRPLAPAPPGPLEGAVRDQFRADVARRYEVDHVSIRGIADEIKRSFGLVRRLLLEADVPLRAPAYHPGT